MTGILWQGICRGRLWSRKTGLKNFARYGILESKKAPAWTGAFSFAWGTATEPNLTVLNVLAFAGSFFFH